MTHDEIELLKRVVETAQDSIGFFCGNPECTAQICRRNYPRSQQIIKAKELLDRLENAE